jgi:branched-subunit amino acid aminotransferase/4-amino-4-deoxychorismate lyase
VTLLALAVSGRGLVDPAEPIVHADDEGFLRGRAAFERTRIYDGTPFRLGAHLERMATSARRIGLPGFDAGALAALAAEAVAAAGEQAEDLRLYWTPGREGIYEPQALALVFDLPPTLEQERARGTRLISLPCPSRLLAGAKSTSYAENLEQKEEAARHDANDVVLVSTEGVVLESSTANVWWREGEALLTPTLELPILAGVTRGALLELAPTAGYRVEEGVFPLERLARADEAFLSSATREVAPVVALDGAPIGDGAPGPAAAALQAALRRLALTE